MKGKINEKQTPSRHDIEKKFKWNIEAMYPGKDIWEADFAMASQLAEEYTPKFEGTLSKGASFLLEAYEEKSKLWQLTERVYVYARMKRDEDNTISEYQEMSDRCRGLMAKVAAALSFFVPEILAIPEEQLKGFIKSEKGLEIYKFAIEDLIREKKHVLSPKEEQLLATLSEVTCASNDIFTMLNNADMKFGNLKDEDEDKVELTHGKYIGFMESQNRGVRKKAFEKMYKAYKNQINTIATIYNYNTKVDVINARIRSYPSALEASLSGDNVPLKVYDNLITVVNENLPTLHRYMDIRKKMLKVKTLRMYDVYVPLIPLPPKEIEFSEAITLMQEGLAPLGEEYTTVVEQGIAEGWIDIYENRNKTSGAYSFGSYDSLPYILLNYQNKLKDVFTLVHEMGHSMHSHYTRKTQPYIYGGHSIFTAEVASTVNEALLMKHLIRKQDTILKSFDKRLHGDALEMKAYLLNLYIEEFRTTVFRQTMFAEFEKMTHAAIEAGEVLTAEWLCATYDELNKRYFGPNLEYDKEISYEWARIPHFYNAFYVYKYATGYSAASAISEKILNEGPEARTNYLEFLKTGESDYPIELLKIAGVDMSKKEPILQAMEVFKGLVDEFEKLVAAR